MRRVLSWMIFAAVLAPAAWAEAEKSTEVVAAARTDAGWLARHESFNARAKQGNVDLLFIGDALAQDWEDSGKEAWSKFYGKRQAVDFGISGDQPANILWRLEHGNIDGISPKLVVLMFGAGVGDSGKPAEEVANGIKAVMEKLRAKLPKTKVLLQGIMPGGEKKEDPRRAWVAKANTLITKLARTNVKLEDVRDAAYLNFGPAFLAADGALKPELISPAGRLTAQGYAVLGEWLEQGVVSMTGEGENALAPVPLDPGAWLTRHEQMNARVKQGHVDLVFIGDSITQGWENNTGRVVWDKFYGKRNAVNLGISRDRIQHVLWRLDHGNLDGITPKLAVVMIGTNNAARTSVEQSCAGIKAIIDRVHAKSPATKVLLLGIFPRGETSQDRCRQVNMKVNDNIAKFADDKTVFYLDIGQKFLAADGTLTKEIMPDQLHPGEKGYTIWAEAIEPMVAKLMGEK